MFTQPKTITIKQLWYNQYDLYKWLINIGEPIRFQDLVCCIQKLEADDRHIVYNYAAKELNLSMTKLDSEVKYNLKHHKIFRI